MDIHIVEWTHCKDEVMRLRQMVFLDELKYDSAYLFDEQDTTATHACAFHGRKIIAAGRIVLNKPLVFLSHVVVHPEYRKQEIGLSIITNLKRFAKNNECLNIQLSARIEAMRFYEQAGFHAIENAYQSFGVWHRKMTLKLG